MTAIKKGDRSIRLALLDDYPDEGWASMDLVAEMVRAHLDRDHAETVAAASIRPPFRPRLARRRRPGPFFNGDRLINRLVDYPKAVRHQVAARSHDVYHVLDHSYAHLVLDLPPGRSVVTCHDLDAFRCLLDPGAEPRPWWFRAFTRRIARGLGRASVVACDSEATARAALASGLVAADRLRVVPLGVADEFTADADPEADAEASRRLGGPPGPDGPAELLHVGSVIPRKRVEVLLEVVAATRRAGTPVRLIKVGSRLTDEQGRRARDLGIRDVVTEVGFVPRPVLAALYRRAALVLQPSSAEGFGLPVVEALACGTPVLASDLEVLREPGGRAAIYAAVDDVPAWARSTRALLDERAHRPDAWRARREAARAQAQPFRWACHARRLVAIYQELSRGDGLSLDSV
jgi:glycosyltransferase involved in cell wall biosynthesis